MTRKERETELDQVGDFMTALFGNQDLEDDCVDMITSLMHLMHNSRVCIDHAIDVAREHYLYELEHPDE